MKNFKIKQIIKLSIVGTIIPFLFGCNKPLSREAAATAIKEKYNLPYNVLENFQFTQTQELNYKIPFHYMAIGQDAYNDEYINFTKRKEVAQNAKFNNPPKLPVFEELENEGLITYTIQVINISVAKADGDLSSPGNLSSHGVDAYGGIFYDFKCVRAVAHVAVPTEQGKKYITTDNNVIIATDEFEKITGIVERKEFKTAEVDYTVKRTNITPFGKIIFNINEETFNRSATFTKYDDGWRIGS